MTTTPNLQIDHIAASQAQKEVTANAGFDALDQALCGLLAKALADADATLTATEAVTAMYLRITGTLTAARTITVPANRKPLMVENATTGGFAVTIKTPSGAGVTINAGLRIGVLEAVRESIDPARDALLTIAPYLDAVKWLLLVVTLIGIAVMVWARIDDRRKGLR